MDYFCQECSSKPGWPWNQEKAFNHSCQRCFRFRPCNDFAWKTGRVVASPAPKPKDLVPTQRNSGAEVNLPHVAGHRSKEEVAASAPIAVDNRTEVDKALDAVQPNRPGVKLEVSKKPGK